jgi:hypothetical protein
MCRASTQKNPKESCMTPRSAGLVFSVLLAVSPPVHAASSPSTTPEALTAPALAGAAPSSSWSAGRDEGYERVEIGRRWYGWQIILVDVANWALFFVGTPLVNEPAVGASMLLYGLGGPIVHAAHGQAGVGAASFGMRLFSPIVGALTAGLVFAPSMEGNDATTTLVLMLLGGMVGALAAQVVDAAALAYELPSRHVAWNDDEARMRALATDQGFTLSPILAPRRDGGFAGLGLTF